MKAALHALQVPCHSTEVGRELAVGCGRQRASSVDQVEPANPFFLSCKPAQAHVTSAAAVPVDNEAVRARALGQAVAPHAQPMGSIDGGGEGGLHHVVQSCRGWQRRGRIRGRLSTVRAKPGAMPIGHHCSATGCRWDRPQHAVGCTAPRWAPAHARMGDRSSAAADGVKELAKETNEWAGWDVVAETGNGWRNEARTRQQGEGRPGAHFCSMSTTVSISSRRPNLRS